MTETEKQLYRVDEVAAILGESVRNIYTWIGDGRISYIRISKKIKIPREELLRIIRDGIPQKNIKIGTNT